MNEHPKDLKLRTKQFALRIVRMYSKLPKSDTVGETGPSVGNVGGRKLSGGIAGTVEGRVYLKGWRLFERN